MEPRPSEKPVASHSEGPPPPCSPERKRRFRIVKLEERISPGGGHGNPSNPTCGNTCHTGCCYPG
jgi:hypothetical protein